MTLGYRQKAGLASCIGWQKRDSEAGKYELEFTTFGSGLLKNVCG